MTEIPTLEKITGEILAAIEEGKGAKEAEMMTDEEWEERIKGTNSPPQVEPQQLIW